MKTSSGHKFPLAHILRHIVLGLLLAGVIAFAFGIFVMWLWNWLMPTLFTLPVITFWQAVGLVILLRLLVGSFKGHDQHHSSHRTPFHEHPYPSFFKKIKHNKTDKWQHYDAFWENEGKQAFDRFVLQKEHDDDSDDQKCEAEDKSHDIT